MAAHLIFMYGLTEGNENAVAVVSKFQPFFYVDIPDGVPSSKQLVFALKDLRIKRGCGSDFLAFSHVEMQCLYTHKGTRTYIKCTGTPGPFLLNSMRQYVKKLEADGVEIEGVTFKPSVHEGKISPELQFMCTRNLKSVGWVKFTGCRMEAENPNRLTRCPYEYNVEYQNLEADDKDSVPIPRVLSFDIEVYSDGARFPLATEPGDVIYNISTVCSNGEKKLFALVKEGDEEFEIEGVSIIRRDTERALLVDYANYVRNLCPNVIIGYNIFRFDIPYMLDRAKFHNVVTDFNVQGFREKERCYVRNLKLTGHNKRVQEFPFAEYSGIVYIDLYPIAQKDYKLDNYKLNTVAKHILGDEKHDIDVKTMQESFRSRDAEMLRKVGEYCIQDSALVLRLFDQINAWIGCCEMARTCNVQIFALYTSGQQIRFLSQIYNYAQRERLIINRSDYIPVMSKYTGATVLGVIPGLYENILPFDFASLYPSAIIAYNLDYTTIIREEDVVEGDNVIEWEEADGEKFKFCFRDASVQKGVIPTLLENLLSARKKTNGVIREKKARLASLTGEELIAEQRAISVLHNRQLSYKISSNSMYGATGVNPAKGILPFMPIAACTTAVGRRSLRAALTYMETVRGAKVVYGDTDSVQCLFPCVSGGTMSTEEMFAMAHEIEADVNKLFRMPMKLCFEEHIFQKFLILSKKMYMSRQLLSDNTTKFNSKGIVLARRDNALYIREEYKQIITAIFDGLDFDDFVEIVLQSYLRPFHVTLGAELKQWLKPDPYGPAWPPLQGPLPPTRLVDYSKYVSTCTVGEAEEYARNMRQLPEDPIELARRLAVAHVGTAQEYIQQAMPANIHLAARIMSRGVRVDVGERLEYVVIENPASTRVSHRVEQYEFFAVHGEYLKIDKLYYLKRLHNPLQAIAGVVYKEAGTRALDQIYAAVQTKQKLKKQLTQCTRIWVTGVSRPRD